MSMRFITASQVIGRHGARSAYTDNGGVYYVVSPFAMTWDDENYYMVAFDSAAGIIKHYRVDKMEKITVLDEERDGQDAYEALDMAVYARKTFGMFTGEEVKVHLRFENHLVGAVLDRLGRDVILVPDGEDHFTVWTDVIVSPQFFAWLCGFQTEAKVIGPDDVDAEERYMSYPKPLSEKSLNRLYMQAGLSTETCAFLHSLFAACANLYGTIALRDVWSVYQELKSDVPRIHRRDLIAFFRNCPSRSAALSGL